MGRSSGDDGPLELQHLTLELVDPAGVDAARGCPSRRGEHLGLDLVDVVLHGVGDREVAVDDMVGDGVQHRGGALGEQLGVLLQPVPQRAQRALAAVPDGDDEVPAGEAHHLAGLDDLAGRGELGVLDVVDGLEDGEEGVVVPLQLGPLVGVDGVLDGERVQPELARRSRRTRASVGSCSPIQAKPPLLAHPPHRLVRRQRRSRLTRWPSR